MATKQTGADLGERGTHSLSRIWHLRLYFMRLDFRPTRTISIILSKPPTNYQKRYFVHFPNFIQKFACGAKNCQKNGLYSATKYLGACPLLQKGYNCVCENSFEKTTRADKK